jgi:serine phosphatase RsbU (regulator of sigma subunit)
MLNKIKISLTFLVILIIAFAGIKESTRTSKFLSNSNITKVKVIQENINSLNAGSPYLINFLLEGISDKQIWSIEQDTNGVMLFANRRGIITFDGVDWKYVKTPSVPYKIKREPTTNKIFVGCNNGIGYLKISDGTYMFEPIEFKDTNIGEITEIVFTNKEVYFYNENYIARINLTDYSDKIVIPNNNLDFSGIITLNDKVYISVRNKGFYEVKKEFLSPVSFSANVLKSEILFSFKMSESKLLIGTDENKLYSFDGETLEEFVSDAQNYLTENYIITGNKLNNSEFAVGTLGGGVVIIDFNSGKTTELLNNSTGLPDDEIYSLNTDLNGGLWITHIFGVSRVDFNLPVKNYGNYYGLKGNIISTCLLDTVLYVVTTDGVYFLTQPKDLNELNNIQNLIKEEKKEVIQNTIQEIMPEIETEEINQNTNTQNSENIEVEENKGFFKKWKDKRNKNKDEDENSEITTEIIEDEVNESNENNDTAVVTNDFTENEISDYENNNTPNYYIYVDKNTTETQTNTFLAFNFYFKAIEGIDEKCKQIIEFENLLILGTNNGLFQISENKPESIINDKYITNILKSELKPVLYVTSLTGIDILSYENSRWSVKPLTINADILENIASIAEDNYGNIWLGSEDKAVLIKLDENSSVIEIKDFSFNTNFSEKVIVKNMYDKIYFFMTEGLYFYNDENQKIEVETFFEEEEKNYLKYISSQEEIVWYYKNKKWNFHDNTNALDSNQTLYLNLFENIRDIKLDSHQNLWVVDGYKSIFKIEKIDTTKNISSNFKIFTKKVYSDSLTFDFEKNITLKHNNNGVFIDFSAPFYLKEKSTKYQYYVEGLMQNWTDWTEEQTIALYLKSGKYKLHIKAQNILGEITGEQVIKITIKPPIWQTGTFYIAVGLVLFILLAVFFRIRQNTLKRRNLLLEQKVTERTLKITLQKEELQSQKEEIEAQRDEIRYQRDIATGQRDMIIIQTKQITDSIEYARRIQTAILPLKEALGDFFSEYFIINMPRDVVSGDFYFFKKVNNKVIVAVADCTGHGVPGAFLSMMGVAYLNEIVSKTEKFYANIILNTLRDNIIDSLHQSQENDRKDGMDISMCVFDNDTREVQFAGAYNPLFIFRDEDIIEVPADKMPVGFHRKKDLTFSTRVMPYVSEDVYYLFSDGFIDQFGGKHGRKFLKGNFKSLLATVGELSLEDQKELIMTAFVDWKGDNHQIDDILVLAVKI